jgi:hypothetical protein
MRRVLAVLLGCAVLGGALTAPAGAHDHRAPSAVLRLGDDAQRGRPLHSGWLARASERFCDFKTRTGLPSFPRALRYAPGDVASVLLREESTPLDVSVTAWRDVDRKGRPTGDAEPIPAALVPVMAGTGAQAWEVRFTPPPAATHLYLAVEAHWPDEEGCAATPDLGSQYASWTFHLAAATR